MDQDSTMEGLIERALQAEHELDVERDRQDPNGYEGGMPIVWRDWWTEEDDQQVLIEGMRAALEAALPGVRLEVWKRAIKFVDSQREDFTDLREVRDRMRSIDPNKEGSEWD